MATLIAFQLIYYGENHKTTNTFHFVQGRFYELGAIPKCQNRKLPLFSTLRFVKQMFSFWGF